MLAPSRYWREIPQRYRLEAGRCKGCGKIAFPPRRVCPACGGKEFDTVNLPREGKILSYTIVHTAAKGFTDETPFAVAIVELDGGARLTAQVVDWNEDELAIGQPVRIEFRRIQKDGESGILCYGYKAVPVK
jgi:hypothetical protein